MKNTLTVKPLTPKLLTQLDKLFNDSPVTQKCYCMYWRIGFDYKKNSPKQNKELFKKEVEQNNAKGLIAFIDENPVGWCQVTPKQNLDHLQKSWKLKNETKENTWCISCFYIKKGYRKQGIASELIKEAIKFSKNNGTQILEAYPVDHKVSTSSTFTGFATTFKKLGFKEIKRNVPARPIMQIKL